MANRKVKERVILRYYCHWIAHPEYSRCPGHFQNGIFCRGCDAVHDLEVKKGWPWHVVPREVPAHSDEQRYFYDEDGAHAVSKVFK